MTVLPPSQGSAAWSCVKGYLAQWDLDAESRPQDTVTLSLRDARFGMRVASAKTSLTAKEGGALFAAAAGSTALLARGKAAAVVRWSLPEFSLQMMVGRGLAQPPSDPALLKPLQEVILGKRPRDDATVEDLFSAKRRHATEKALAEELKRRRWAPSLELVTEIIRRECWAAASALLNLPELDEDLSIKLLGARVELLARVVRRARAPQRLEQALRNNLSTSQLPKILEVLLHWLGAYQEFSQEQLQKEVPSLPDLQDVVTFLGAVAEGCLPHLVDLEVDLLQRTLEAVEKLQADEKRAAILYAHVREAYRVRTPPRASVQPPAIEVALFEDF